MFHNVLFDSDSDQKILSGVLYHLFFWYLLLLVNSNCIFKFCIRQVAALFSAEVWNLWSLPMISGRELFIMV